MLNKASATIFSGVIGLTLGDERFLFNTKGYALNFCLLSAVTDVIRV